MLNWLESLRSGLSRKRSSDRMDSQKPKLTTRKNLENLRPFFLQHWHAGAIGLGLVLFASLLSFPQPLINRFVIDDVIVAKRLDLLPLAIILLVGVKLLSMGAEFLQQYYFTRFEQKVMLDMQQTLLDHTLRLPKAFFDDNAVGYLVSRLVSDFQSLRWFFSSSVAYIISSIVQFIGGVIFLFYLEWRLGIITLIILPLFVFFARYFADRMHILSHHYMERSANVLQRFEETLVSVPLIKTFTTERREEKRVISAVSDNQQIEMEQNTVNALATLVLKIVPDLARGVVLIAGVYWIILGKWTLGSLLAFQSYLGYVYGPALSLASSNLQFQNALTALERVSTILNSDPEENSINGKVVTHLKGDVRFEHVSFSYNGAENVLEDISFAIQPGEHIAIIGPSGVGKTTLISLLLCFYQPTSGVILFDNSSSKEYNLTSLRQRIGYVSQLTQLMEGTIRENLVYGNTAATQIEIDQAARVAGILDTIVNLPQGYDTIVGEKGVNFSEGQKQRLSIARALIKDPDILIMDEPTAALDSLTESLIFETLPTKIHGKTLFMIAHRLSTIKNADQILVLTDKHQSGFGTHAELMGNNLYYRSLIENNNL